MNASYNNSFGSSKSLKCRVWGRILWGMMAAMLMLVVGIVGSEGVSAVGVGDTCYYAQYSVTTGKDKEMHNQNVIPTEETKTISTNRVCSDGNQLYATKAEDGAVYKYAVQGKNVCLLWGSEIKCMFTGTDNLSGVGSTSLSDGVRLLASDNIPNANGTFSETRSADKIALEDELTMGEREIEKARGDSNTDSCVSLEYTYNGKKRYTNKLCVNSKGKLYSTTEGASEDNPTFVARESNWAAMNIKGNTEIGKTDWNGTMALNEFAGVVWANACKNGSACNGYELTGEYIVADEDSEKWNDADQTSTEDSEGENAVCYKGSGALGWIMCPIIQGVSGVGEYMWQQIEDNHLKLPANEIFKDDGGVEQAWQIVQGIANVAFVILFLVVIFSQITGKGIDNYGIKKILPKLIIAAVLMNLSYFICQLAVDLSNIIGNGINQMLSGLAGDIANAGGAAGNEVSDASELTSWLAVSGLAGGGVALFTLLNPVTALAAGASIGLAVLGLVITIVAAMLVLYLILVIREAGTVIMIVLAPVAIVCYMLPNTEKWFKRWLDIGKALLLVYPLCGLVVGGGQLAGAILGGIDNSSMKIAGMIIQVLPFFLIPMLLRRSLSLMGNVGARVSNVGRNLGRRGSVRAQGAVQNSNRFKDWSQYQREMSTVQRAQRVKNRLGNRKNLSERDTERLSKANAALVSYEGKKKQAMIGADNDLGYEIALAHQDVAFANEREKSFSEIFGRNEKKVNQGELEKALSGGDAERASAALGTLFQQGGIDEALQVLNNSKLDWTNMNSGVRTRILQTMASSNVDAAKSYAKYRQKGGTRSFNQWVRGDMTGVNATEEAKLVKPENMSYAAHLKENGVHAVDSYSKDEMQFVQNNKDNIRTELGEGFYGAMLSSTAVNSKDARVKTLAEDTIAKDISEGKLDIDHLGLTPEMIGAMRDDTALAIKKGYVDMWKRQVPGISDADAERDAMNYIRSNLSKQINAINTDDRIRNRTSKGVKDVFNIR